MLIYPLWWRVALAACTGGVSEFVIFFVRGHRIRQYKRAARAAAAQEAYRTFLLEQMVRNTRAIPPRPDSVN